MGRGWGVKRLRSRTGVIGRFRVSDSKQAARATNDDHGSAAWSFRGRICMVFNIYVRPIRKRRQKTVKNQRVNTYSSYFWFNLRNQREGRVYAHATQGAEPGGKLHFPPRRPIVHR